MSCSPDDPHLTPDQRRREIATFFSRGILRLHSAGQPASESAVLQ